MTGTQTNTAPPTRQGRSLALEADPRRLAFEDWALSVIPEIKYVQGLLQEKLSDNPAQLIGDLQAIECWYGRMTKLLAGANSYLDYNTNAELPEKEKGITDTDRKAIVEAAVHQERRLRDEMDGVVRAIELRISLGQSVIRANAGEARHGSRHEA